MIPEGRLSVRTRPGRLLNPIPAGPDSSIHWGPVALNNPLEGLFYQLWSVRADGGEIFLSAPNRPEQLHLSRPTPVLEVSLAFDQNGQPYVAFVEEDGIARMHWYDAEIPGFAVMELEPGVLTPRITLDDARPLVIPSSDIILGYIREGLLRYRHQRNRFSEEYTLTQGEGGPVVEADGLQHISMNSNLRLEFIVEVTE